MHKKTAIDNRVLGRYDMAVASLGKKATKQQLRRIRLVA